MIKKKKKSINIFISAHTSYLRLTDHFEFVRGTMLLLILKIWARHSKRIFEDNNLIFFLNFSGLNVFTRKIEKTVVEQSIPPIIAIFRRNFYIFRHIRQNIDDNDLFFLIYFQN